MGNISVLDLDIAIRTIVDKSPYLRLFFIEDIEICTNHRRLFCHLREFMSPYFALNERCRSPSSLHVKSFALSNTQLSKYLDLFPLFRVTFQYGGHPRRPYFEWRTTENGTVKISASKYLNALAIHDTGKQTLSLLSTNKRISRLTRKIIRDEILYTRYRQQGMAMIHAACVADERGVLIVGASGTGKTSTMILLMIDGGLSLVSSDLCFLERQENRFVVWGTPEKVCVGIGTMFQHRQLEKLITPKYHDIESSALWDVEKKVLLKRDWLASITNTVCSVNVQLGLIVFVRLDRTLKGIEVNSMKSTEVEARLTDNLIRYHYKDIEKPWGNTVNLDEGEAEELARGLIRDISSSIPAIDLGFNGNPLGIAKTVLKHLRTLQGSRGTS